jgi:hypothetical protein
LNATPNRAELRSGVKCPNRAELRSVAELRRVVELPRRAELRRVVELPRRAELRSRAADGLRTIPDALWDLPAKIPSWWPSD